MNMKWLGWGSLLLGCLSGCAASSPARGARADSGGPIELDLPGVRSKAAPVAPSGKACPDDIADEPALEDKSYTGREARTWHVNVDLLAPSLEKPLLQREVHKPFTLASGPLELLIHRYLSEKGELSDATLVTLARPHEGGHCIVSSWHLGGMEGKASLVDTWAAQDGKHIIFLMKTVPTEDSLAKSANWVVVGSDGRRAWAALGTPPQHHLMVPSVKLFPNGKDLYLDIQQRYVTRLRLGPDGRFIVPTQGN
ncbi:hypothetical protein A176_007220 [Myxococcus hansupus]|uniref:Lipoprotein n=1 Tax=Pseudomyxococcus hansupus TaxID=1297742 RepID=A0A0H4X8J1_9BACT|nr:hypothetical protein [Myxococcus hansupus]AKQ70308.1 hypothetical protein A176_007220 [Myxococcus hansupus]